MPIPLIILLVFFVGCLLYFPYILWRNDRVCAERIRVVEEVFLLNMEDIRNGVHTGSWRMDYFTTITYDQMLYKIWKPVKSFYKNHPCLKKYNDAVLNLKVIED